MRSYLYLLLGIGLVALWLFEVLLPEAVLVSAGPDFKLGINWITWLDLVAGLAAVMGITIMGRYWAFGLCVGLLALTVVGVAVKAPSWISGWNFIFSVYAGSLGLFDNKLKPSEKLFSKRPFRPRKAA